MHCVILSNDLAIGSRAAAVGTATNGRIWVALSPARLLEILQQESVDVVVVDLQSHSLDEALVDQVRALGTKGCRIAAFGPHVQESRLQAARDAGCDHVWTRGQWSQQLATLMGARNTRNDGFGISSDEGAAP